MTKLPIPSNLWELVLAFLKAGKSGRIELDVKDGRVQRITIAESWRSSE